MNRYTDYGPGDEQTWPPYSGHPNDPRAPLEEEGIPWEDQTDRERTDSLEADDTITRRDLCEWLVAAERKLEQAGIK